MACTSKLSGAPTCKALCARRHRAMQLQGLYPVEQNMSGKARKPRTAAVLQRLGSLAANVPCLHHNVPVAMASACLAVHLQDKCREQCDRSSAARGPMAHQNVPVLGDLLHLAGLALQCNEESACSIAACSPVVCQDVAMPCGSFTTAGLFFRTIGGNDVPSARLHAALSSA